MAIIKPLSTQSRSPTSGQNSTIDDASIIRVLNRSSGGTALLEIRTVSNDAGSKVGEIDIAPFEVVYIRKDPSHYVHSSSSAVLVFSVAVNPNPGSV